MSDLVNLIDSIVKKYIDNQQLTNIAPCRVIRIVDDSNVEIELISNNARYVVPNYSGSPLAIGENVQLFYKKMINQNTAYIGASPYKNTISGINIIKMPTLTGVVDSGGLVISEINVKTISDTNVTITLNCCATGDSDSVIKFIVVVDDNELEYQPIVTVNTAIHSAVSFSLPVFFITGNHNIKINAIGAGSIEQVFAYISGHNIEEISHSFDDTLEDDYLYRTDSDYTEIITYTGKSKRPLIPEILNGKPVKYLSMVAFLSQNIVSAYIPDGVQEIG